MWAALFLPIPLAKFPLELGDSTQGSDFWKSLIPRVGQCPARCPHGHLWCPPGAVHPSVLWVCFGQGGCRGCSCKEGSQTAFVNRQMRTRRDTAGLGASPGLETGDQPPPLSSSVVVGKACPLPEPQVFRCKEGQDIIVFETPSSPNLNPGCVTLGGLLSSLSFLICKVRITNAPTL